MSITKISHANATKQSSYTRKQAAKLEETKAKLDGVKAKIKTAVANGQIESSEQLMKAELQAESHLATVEQRLAQVKDASEVSLDDLKIGLELAWDDLAISIRKIVARLTS